MNNKIKYGLIGASGKLGKEVHNVFSENGHQLVFAFDIDGEWKEGTPELLIDCSLPEVFTKSIDYLCKFEIPFIIATTGLSKEEIKTLKTLSLQYPIVQSYNYSIGVQVMLRLIKQAKNYLNDWDIEITETHHRFKKDKPSGTAKMIQELFDPKKINTSSLRLGNVAGEHEIQFGSLGEVLKISHSALSRRTFAEGILKSAEFIIGKKRGFYTFEEILFNEKFN